MTDIWYTVLLSGISGIFLGELWMFVLVGLYYRHLTNSLNVS